MKGPLLLIESMQRTKNHKGGSQREQGYLTAEAPNFIRELPEFFDNSEVRTLAEIEDELFRIMKAFIRELIKALHKANR